MMSSRARPRPEPVEVAVVVAAIDARATLEASLRRFLDEVGPRGELILADASTDGTADEAARRFPSARIIRRPPGTLAPELWRDGLLATEAPLVALSTAAMIPGPGWLAALKDRLETTGAVGVGGPIEPGPGLSAFDRAVYLHRYLRYLPPLDGGTEPPGDNALYRRDDLLELADAWPTGFWEVAVQRRLREWGRRLEMAEGASVAFGGGSRLASTLARRVIHARRYAADRANDWGMVERLARLAALPVVPALLAARIARTLRMRRPPIGPWLPALPMLALLLGAWTVGEAMGMIRPGRPRPEAGSGSARAVRGRAA